jgi:hypothetical protein
MAAELLYVLSEEQFERLTDIAASPHFIHETLNTVGESATLKCILPQRKGDRSADRRSTGRIASAPGAFRSVRRRPCSDAAAGLPAEEARARDQAWSEGISAYLLGQEDRVIQVASWHQIADKVELSKALGVMPTRILRDRVRIALVAHWADWIWTYSGLPRGGKRS